MPKIMENPDEWPRHRPPKWKYGVMWQAARFGCKLGRAYPRAPLDAVADAAVDEILFFQHGAPGANEALKGYDRELIK